MTRDPKAIAAHFAEVLDEGCVSFGSQLERRGTGYCAESLDAGVLLRPHNTRQLAQICAVARSHSIGLVPHGGLTGLVESTASHPGQAVVSVERMNSIHRIDPAQGIAIVDAGVTLEALQAALAPLGMTFGVDIPARGSCTIGGMIATNAGGIRVLRYGMMRANVLGLEVVLADGRVLDLMNTLLKNNAGYDLKQLFIGSEGTLGLVSRAALRIWPIERFQSTALVSCEDPGLLAALFERARSHFGSDLLAFEALWPSYYALTTEQPGFPRRPLATGAALYVVLEVAGKSSAAGQDALVGFLETALEAGLVSDGVVAKSDAERAAVWRAREDSDAINHHFPHALSYDVGVELADICGFAEAIAEAFAARLPEAQPHLFGHVGDGNLHVLVGVSDAQLARREDYDRTVYETLSRFPRSTISAEHGIGTEKMPYLAGSLPSDVLGIMRQLKMTLDPDNVMNPGKIFTL